MAEKLPELSQEQRDGLSQAMAHAFLDGLPDAGGDPGEPWQPGPGEIGGYPHG